MGVVHSMDEGQVSRVSSALRQSAESIQGINNKFDVVDEHWRGVQAFNSKINTRVEDTLGSFQRLDETVNARVRTALDTVKHATDELTQVMENMVYALQEFDMRREMNQLPKAVIPLMIPLIILMIELAIANAYLGILLTRLPDVSDKYSTYLLANAATVLLGLSLSLLWLGSYRGWLSYKTRQRAKLQRSEERVDDEAGDAEDPLNEAPACASDEHSRHPEEGSPAADSPPAGYAVPEEEEVDKDRRVTSVLNVASMQQLKAELRRRLEPSGGPGDDEVLHDISGCSAARHIRPTRALPNRGPRPSRFGDLCARDGERRHGAERSLPSPRQGQVEPMTPGSSGLPEGQQGGAVGGDATESRNAGAPPGPLKPRPGPRIHWSAPFRAEVMWGASGRERAS